MNPITAQVLWDTLSPIKGELEQFACQSLSAPHSAERAGYEPLAFLLSYSSRNVKAQLWVRRGGKIYLCKYDYLEGPTTKEYPHMNAAMWDFKLKAKAIYDKDDIYWLWKAAPEWSKSA